VPGSMSYSLPLKITMVVCTSLNLLVISMLSLVGPVTLITHFLTSTYTTRLNTGANIFSYPCFSFRNAVYSQRSTQRSTGCSLSAATMRHPWRSSTNSNHPTYLKHPSSVPPFLHCCIILASSLEAKVESTYVLLGTQPPQGSHGRKHF
jgi:hypothetical protein